MQRAEPVSRGRVADSLAALLEVEGPDLVRCTYLTLLSRKPDPSGRDSAEAFLRRGGRKIDLVCSIAQSNEGRALGAVLPGLPLALRRRRLGRLPLVGPLLQRMLGLERTGRLHRAERMLAYAVAALHETVAIRLHGVENLLAIEEGQNSGHLQGRPTAGSALVTVRGRQIMRTLTMRLT